MKSKKLLTFAAGALAVSMAVTAQAQTTSGTVGVQLVQDYAGGTVSAMNGSHYGSANAQGGVVNQNNWNVADPVVVTGSGGGPITYFNSPVTNAYLFNSWGDNPYYPGVGYRQIPLIGLNSTVMNSAGAATGLTFNLSGFNGSDGFQNTIPNPFPGDDVWWMTNGVHNGNFGGGIFSGAGSASLTLGGLTAASSYDVILTLGTPWYFGQQTCSVSFGGVTNYLLTCTGTAPSGWSQSTATSAGAAAATNYVEFDSISGAALNGGAQFTFTGNGVGVSSFQVIEVPEPSTFAAMVGGLGMLLAGQRIRRSRKS